MGAYVLPPGAVVRPGEEEVGVQVACSRCGEDWPADEEFFYVKRRRGREPTLDSVCRACRADARVAKASTTEARLARYVAEQDRANRRAYERALDRLRWGAMTPAQRDSRNARRRARRHAA